MCEIELRLYGSVGVNEDRVTSNAEFLSAYLRKGFVLVSEAHGHNTRASGNGYHISRDDVDGSFGFFGKKEWNTLPESIKTLGNIDLFKVKLKQYLMANY